MSEVGERTIPIPFAFDTAIGYWTGELDWDLLAEALASLVGRANPPVASALAAWIDAARAGDAEPLACGSLTLTIEDQSLVLRGEEVAVETAAVSLLRRLGSGRS